MSRQRTILMTFAGRRDRMELLTRYAGAAIEAGLIDEWHVWDFTRTAEDGRWLRELFPFTQTTPSHTPEYFRWPHSFELGEDALRLPVEARTTGDAHIGLARTAGEGASYEIVLGGWGNAFSAIRAFDDAQELLDVAARKPAEPLLAVSTPRLWSEFDASLVEIEIGAEGLKVFFDGALLMSDPTPVAPGSFDIHYRTGHGANGEWRLPGLGAAAARLFVRGPAAHHPANAMFYTRAYQYYAANAARHRDDVFLKCDDDIVFFDLQRLAEFIAFRKAHPEYFLVSANVVNNGVCAHFQQQDGIIPADLMECELPAGGLCGSIWSEGAKAEALHDFFLTDPGAFLRSGSEPVVWNQRISINFIALLGRDLVHIPDIMADDEHDLCYGVRKRARKANCIYPGFVAAHLSFWRQDQDMQLGRLLEGYDALARRAIGGFILGPVCSDSVSETEAVG